MKGHTNQKLFFQNAYSKAQLSHAYLFSGVDGIGKKLFAKTMAMGLLSGKPELFKDIPFDVIEKFEHPDLYIFEAKKDPKDELGLNIKSVRRVSEISEMSSYSGGWKVIIFDDVHVLCQGSAEAANALLKNLEEPGEKTIFLLISSKPERVLNTIKSRCIITNFKPLDEFTLNEVLSEISPADDWSAVMPFAEGSPGKALALKNFKAEPIIRALNSKDKEGLGFALFDANNKEALTNAAQILLVHFINSYKSDCNPDTMILIQFLNEFIRNLEYNININIQLLNLYAKITGTF